MSGAVRPPDLRDSWLVAVIPADARRFRVADPALAVTLAAEGAELVAERPDVEIAGAAAIRGDAAVAAVPLASRLLLPGGKLRRAWTRLRSALSIRLRARAGARLLRARGYDTVTVIAWDISQSMRLPSFDSGTRRGVELLPRFAVVVGTRGPLPEPAVTTAATAAGGRFGAPRLAGLAVALSDDAVLRVGFGADRVSLERHRRGIEQVAGRGLPAPRPLDHGSAGLTAWTLESRLRGEPAPPGVHGRLLDDCIAFLGTLFVPAEGRWNGSEQAAAVGAALGPGPDTAAAHRLATRLEQQLAGVQLGHVHGDFWSGNLLVDGVRLAGVLDWEAARPDGLPVLDLLQLLLATDRPHVDEQWGEAVTGHLLPWATGGGDERLRRYCMRVGLDPDPDVLEALVAAYWLERVGYHLTTYVNRLESPVYLERNVRAPLRTLAGPS